MQSAIQHFKYFICLSVTFIYIHYLQAMYTALKIMIYHKHTILSSFENYVLFKKSNKTLRF